MGDRLLRLRHDAVVGGDDENCNVSDLRAARPHCGKCFVAGRVEERDSPAVDLRLVRADVLRDPSRLGLHHGGLADRVEERGLAVVDVPHDRHDRRARNEVLVLVLELLGLELLLGGVLDRDLTLELGPDDLDVLVGERLCRSPHLAERHQDLDELRHRDPERLREVLDGHPGLDGGWTGRRRSGLGPWSRRRSGAIAWLPSVTSSRAAALDDDAALASPGPSAGTNRAVGSVSSVGHQAAV